MSKKTYIAYGTQLHTQFRMEDGGLADIKFTPYSNYESGRGGSVFTTENERLQYAIEKDHRYGNMIHLKMIDGMLPEVWYEKQAAGVMNAEPEKQVKIVNVMTAKDAMTYLQDNFGWAPKGRPTKKSIIEAAESYGVEFSGI